MKRELGEQGKHAFLVDDLPYFTRESESLSLAHTGMHISKGLNIKVGEPQRFLLDGAYVSALPFMYNRFICYFLQSDSDKIKVYSEWCDQ